MSNERPFIIACDFHGVLLDSKNPHLVKKPISDKDIRLAEEMSTRLDPLILQMPSNKVEAISLGRSLLRIPGSIIQFHRGMDYFHSYYPVKESIHSFMKMSNAGVDCFIYSGIPIEDKLLFLRKIIELGLWPYLNKDNPAFLRPGMNVHPGVFKLAVHMALEPEKEVIAIDDDAYLGLIIAGYFDKKVYIVKRQEDCQRQLNMALPESIDREVAERNLVFDSSIELVYRTLLDNGKIEDFAKGHRLENSKVPLM